MCYACQSRSTYGGLLGSCLKILNFTHTAAELACNEQHLLQTTGMASEQMQVLVQLVQGHLGWCSKCEEQEAKPGV